jgi:hypothetical protein
VVKDGRWTGFGVAPEAPVDHSLPVLTATDQQGNVRAIVVGYACHCTTLGGNFNKICGDWAGYACDALERDIPGAIPMVVIGCGADANPKPRGTLEQAKTHGEALASSARAVLKEPMSRLAAPASARLERLELPLSKLPERKIWVEAAAGKGQAARRARLNLERMDRGEEMPATVLFTVQSWSFGDRLCLVFLAGEVVVDYATLLRQVLDKERLWIVAYANGVPCYIPSKRILREGGYEAVDSMIYYDRAAPFAEECEDHVVRAVESIVPDTFRVGREARR